MGYNTYTIFIKDKTKVSSNEITQNNVSSSGTIKKTTKLPTSRKQKGRPRTGKAVEHNRISRVWNSTANKVTNGFWEKANRAGKSIKGAILYNSGVGYAIIAQFALNEVFKQFDNYRRTQSERNEKDSLKIRVGALDLGSGDSYSLNRNFWSGRITYKTNR